jgi:hypothetical protein
VKHYSTVELAKVLNVGRDSLYRWMDAGVIPSGRVVVLPIANTRVRVWSPSDVAAIRKFLRESYVAGRGRRKKGR